MDFSHRKRPKADASKMQRCPVKTVEPFVFMLCPVYVLLLKNKKFVAVKAPLDFFIPEELERFTEKDPFYVPEFVKVAKPFQEAGRSMRAALIWEPQNPKTKWKKNEKGEVELSFPQIKLPPSPFERSYAVLKLLAPLWGKGVEIEPFFIAVFINELCDPLSREMLMNARDESVERFEFAILRSSWAVFLGLHMGFNDVPFLNRYRKLAFQRAFAQEGFEPANEADELMELAFDTFSFAEERMLTVDLFEGRDERVAQKLIARLRRIEEKYHKINAKAAATIYGEDGLIDGAVW